MSKWMGSLAFLGIVGMGGSALAAAPTFDEVDTNKDGLLSRSEAMQVEGLDFAEADRNEDGMLDRSEYDAATG